MGYDLALGYNPYISFFPNILLILLAKLKSDRRGPRESVTGA